MAKLEKAEIERRLSALPGWELKDEAISKLYRFKEFMTESTSSTRWRRWPRRPTIIPT